LPTGYDANFLKAVYAKLQGSDYLVDPDRFASRYFGVAHYALHSADFVEKNKDSVGAHVIAAFKSSRNLS
jgi:myosin heavy subunit